MDLTMAFVLIVFALLGGMVAGYREKLHDLRRKACKKLASERTDYVTWPLTKREEVTENILFWIRFQREIE